MAEFINTVDAIGDEMLCTQFIERSITEYKDNDINTLGGFAFFYCQSLTLVNIPNVNAISQQCFCRCKLLMTVDTANLSNLSQLAFQDSSALKSLILRRTTSVCSLQNTNAFSGTDIGKGNGYIYVPSALLATYQTATNWSTYAAQFRALEDYTVDGTITGDLDENKI